jgi:hypothetical protein
VADLAKNLAAVVAALPAGEIVVDAAFEPARAASVLAQGEPVWLRALPDPGEPGGDGYGPAPRDPAWIRVAPGRAEVELVTHAATIARAEARAKSVTLVTARVTWGTSAAPLVRHLARGVVALEPGGAFVVASAITDDEGHARAALMPILGPLAVALGLEVDGATSGPSSAHDASPAASSSSEASAATARELARFTLGWEGDRRVLRDLVHPGPRASGWIWSTIALGSGTGALVTVARLVSSVNATAPWTTLAAHAGVAVVFALGAFAFFHVARHALRYRAAGAPVAVFADDRVVVMPWVRRDGAIDPKPEGRFGAGVRIAEIRKTETVTRDGVETVSLDTEHGAIDVAGGLSAPALEALRIAIENACAGVAAPRRKTAIMRARERNQREAEA